MQNFLFNSTYVLCNMCYSLREFSSEAKNRALSWLPSQYKVMGFQLKPVTNVTGKPKSALIPHLLSGTHLAADYLGR